MANPNQSWAFEEELNRTHEAVSRRNKQLLYGCEGSLCLWAELSLPKPSLLLAQYQEFKGSALQASRTMGMGAVSALRGVYA